MQNSTALHTGKGNNTFMLHLPCTTQCNIYTPHTDPMTCYFSTWLSLPVLQGKSSAEAAVNVKERLFPVLKANWMLWPIAQVCNSIIIYYYGKARELV